MRSFYDKKDGYRYTIQKGLATTRNIGNGIYFSDRSKEEELDMLKDALENSDSVVIGAGAGLSTSAGFTYSGKRFEKYFFDFAEKFNISDMYSGGFFPYPNEETKWAWWARNIYFNRYINAPKPVYKDLLALIEDKDYFVITTNADHQFQKAGFDKTRLFYTQGDFGLFQSLDGKNQNTYDNEEWVIKAMEAQGFVKNSDGVFDLPENGKIAMRIPSSLIPICKDDNSHVTMNLRIDDSFVEDEGWHAASERYYDFLKAHKYSKVLYLELGVGANTPVIIKYPFWHMVSNNKNAKYACINFGESFAPKQIEDRSICIDGDIGEVIKNFYKKYNEIVLKKYEV